jgi:hypothetical protein
MLHDYDDEYGTCVETYATFRIFSDVLTPDDISAVIRTAPTSSYRDGELRTTSPNAKDPYYRTNGWFYSTKGKLKSRDCRRHLDLVIEAALTPKPLSELRERGCSMDITIFYNYTQGGPTISPHQMHALAEARIDVWWDLYKSSEKESND